MFNLVLRQSFHEQQPFSGCILPLTMSDATIFKKMNPISHSLSYFTSIRDRKHPNNDYETHIKTIKDAFRKERKKR